MKFINNYATQRGDLTRTVFGSSEFRGEFFGRFGAFFENPTRTEIIRDGFELNRFNPPPE